MTQRPPPRNGALVAAVVGSLGAAVAVVIAIVQLIDSFEYEGGLDASSGTNRWRAAAFLGVGVLAAVASRALLAWRARHRDDEEPAE
jgi:hypothetical protein